MKYSQCIHREGHAIVYWKKTNTNYLVTNYNTINEQILRGCDKDERVGETEAHFR